jgi:anti-sigma B factor antagonist
VSDNSPTRIRPSGDLYPRHPAARDTSRGTLHLSGYLFPPGAVIVLDGELDVASIPGLTAHLDQPGLACLERLVADVSALQFCDCAGLGALVKIHRLAGESGGWLRLCGATAGMHKLLGAVGLSQVLLCYPGVAQAFADAPAPERQRHPRQAR